MSRIVLASKSPSRAALLAGAGLDFDLEPSNVDERAVELPLLAAGIDPGGLALALAEAKAVAVARRRPGDLVLGCDQTLGLDGERFVKAESLDDARRQLERLRGRAHELHSALVLARGDTVLWRTVEVARLTVRPFSDAFLDAYVEANRDDLLGSVGCYRLEGPGIGLFEAIDGDYFTILGLPLLPLLAELRRTGVLAS